jgi:glycosyltransferase involved in cell wall biosynthesis
MLFERPVIVSDCLPQQEVIEKEGCGLVFANENAEDLARQIERLFNDPALLKEMGAKGRQAALTKYHVGAFRHILESLYAHFNKIKQKL